jgi:uncharacterized protein
VSGAIPSCAGRSGSGKTYAMGVLLERLDPIADAAEFGVALQISEGLGTSRFSPADMRGRAEELDDPAPAGWPCGYGFCGSTGWRSGPTSGHPAIMDRLPDDWRAVVFDLGSLQTSQERSIVAAAVVSALWQWRRDRQPALLVINEAHNVCPDAPADANQALATEHLIAIAAEGRKYGLYLLRATQRPPRSTRTSSHSATTSRS